MTFVWGIKNILLKLLMFLMEGNYAFLCKMAYMKKRTKYLSLVGMMDKITNKNLNIHLQLYVF